MGLDLFDTWSRAKRPFTPADPARVTMYVCGPTVYDHAHIGNFRAAVVFDLLFRMLRFHYGEGAVIYARNFTDIDDKIIRAARESGEPIEALTGRFAQIYRDETRAFNNLPPTIETLATGHIGEMIALVEKLLAAGFAYIAQGHVLFAVDLYKDYGRLSGADTDEMLAGARVEVAPYKKSPADFVLWKPSAANEPGWESPPHWKIGARGRPGWHLECSAMIEKALGTTIDIHGGGQDLRFPHHENEIAQSACAHGGAPLARYWVHNGFLRMGADKMSKSLGNVALPRDLLKEWPGEALRFALLSAQYRQPLEWTNELLEQSKRQLDRFYRLFLETPVAAAAPPASILMALDDDLNTPEAIAGLHELRDIAVQMTGDAKLRALASLKSAGELMGLFASDPAQWFKARSGTAPTGPDDAEIERLIAERASARLAKDFARADGIRDDLLKQGVVLEDGPKGATWRRR
ncbi:MAG: cysteine--tRNA ligase [Parvularculaceae bacterium]